MTQNEDGDRDGDGDSQYNLDPNVVQKIEEGGEATLGLLDLLAPLFGPAGGVVVGAFASALAVFRKIHPKLEIAQNKYELSNTIALIVVEEIEHLKKEHPQIWKKMAKKLAIECEASGIDTKIIENAIRGLRGLPAKK